MTALLQVDATGRLVSPDGAIPITYNDPFPTGNGNYGFVEPAYGQVFHTEVGYEHNVVDEFNNITAEASSFFSVSAGLSPGFADGAIHQYGPVGKGWMAWTQENGNPNWRGVENEDGGDDSRPLTTAQLISNALILEALSRLDGFPIQATDDPNNGRGLIFHVDGGASWGGHNCLPLDTTEVLTPAGWVDLRSVQMDDEVASWSPDSGLISFDHPLHIVEPYESPTVRVHWIECTADHHFYTRQDRERPYKVKLANELRVNDRIPLAGSFVANGLPTISNDWLRLLVHTEADGSFMKSGYGVEWHYSRHRKIERLENLLTRLDIPFSRCDQSNGTVKFRVWGADFISTIEQWLPGKRFGWILLNMTDDQFEVFDEELMLADGSVTRQLYRSNSESRDFVQALYHLHGRRANVEGQGGLQMTKSADWRTRPATMCFYRKAPESGRDSALVGCVTTVNDTLVVRQLGKVAIVGNCPAPTREAQRPTILYLALLSRQPPAPKGGTNMACDVPTGGQLAVRLDGGVYNYNGSRYYGSAGQTDPNKPPGPGNSFVPSHPIVGIAATKTGNGYWMVGSDGGIFSFGDAAYHGSSPANPSWLTPVVGICRDDAHVNGYIIFADAGGAAPAEYACNETTRYK